MLGVAVELRPRHVKVGPAGPGGRTGPRTEGVVSACGVACYTQHAAPHYAVLNAALCALL